MDNYSLPTSSRCSGNISSSPINRNDQKRKHHSFHFPLLDFEKFFPEEVEFSLPASFLTTERQNGLCQDVNMTLDNVAHSAIPDDKNSISYSSTFSNKKVKHSNTGTPINTKPMQKKSLSSTRILPKLTRVRKSRKSSRTLPKFGEQQISLSPEVNHENSNDYNNVIVNTSIFTEKMSPSSVFVGGSIKMETTQTLDEKFLENCFS
ncbi:3227_t:CDS:1, partial [Ambispora gerdemannii]